MGILFTSLMTLSLMLPCSLTNSVQSQTPKPAPPKVVVNGALPHVSPDGKRIAFFSNRTGADDLFVINSDGTSATQLTKTTERESFVGWTADSKNILFSVLKAGVSTIYKIDLNGQNQLLITRVSGRSPVSSPDGKKLLYASGSWTEMSLYLTTLSGESPRKINDGKSIAWNTRWSPDGKLFAFTGRSDPKSELAVFVANADGTNVRQVSRVPLEEGAAQGPEWSKDGRLLAIQVSSRVKKNSAHIWLVDVATGESRKLAAHDEEYLDETPSWFPDGKRLAFQSDRNGRMEVWIMNVDGSNQKQLTR